MKHVAIPMARNLSQKFLESNTNYTHLCPPSFPAEYSVFMCLDKEFAPNTSAFRSQ